MAGRIPTQIGELSKLPLVCLHANQLSGAYRHAALLRSTGRAVGRCDALCWEISAGPIPTEIGRMTQLDYLLLYKNQLSGACARELTWVRLASDATLPW